MSVAPRKVIVAGGYGTGSTHAYRIVRAILQAANIEHFARGISEELLREELARNGWVVLKTHDALAAPQENLRIVLCKRQPYDAAASQLRMSNQSPEQIVAFMRKTHAIEAAYAGRDDVVEIRYEDFYHRPEAKVRLIADHIGIGLAEESIRTIADETGIEATKQVTDELAAADSESELRPGHIGPGLGKPGGGDTLPPSMRREIEAIYDL